MKKIILSAAVAAMALTTTASALEDIKVNGQTKLFYETWNKGDNSIFSKNSAGGEVAVTVGMTGKQGDVAFEGEVSYGTTMGLENNVVTDVRTDAVQEDLYVSKANFTIPLVANTALKMGRQELNTPLAFTEKWNSLQNNFDAAVLVNSSVKNTTIIGAFVGQTNTTGSMTWKADNTFHQLHGGAYALAALYNNETLAVNAWYYHIMDAKRSTNAGGLGLAKDGAGDVDALWVDAGMTMAGVNVKGYVAQITPDDSAIDSSLGFALSASAKVSGWTVSAAASMVDEDSALPIANIATGFKKTKLPTAGVYTDGLYVAQAGSTAVKLKAAGKVGSTGLAVQAVNNTNSGADGQAMGLLAKNAETLETTEVDFIVSQKLGDINLKAIVLHRMFADDATDDTAGGQHVRVIASVNF
jgi:hypothetical protein